MLRLDCQIFLRPQSVPHKEERLSSVQICNTRRCEASSFCLVANAIGMCRQTLVATRDTKFYDNPYGLKDAVSCTDGRWGMAKLLVAFGGRG